MRAPTPPTSALKTAPVDTALQANAVARQHGLRPLILLLFLGSLALFSDVCIQFLSGRDAGIDRSILLAFRMPGDLSKPIGPSWLLQTAIDLSALGGFTLIWLFTAATTGFLVLVKRWRGVGLFLGAVVGVSILNAVVKISFHRARPEVVPHLAEVSNASFPSGHAMISAATYLTIGAMLAQSQPSIRARGYLMSLAVILTLMIGISRLYLGVHWPSDVLAGWTLGSAWALVSWAISRRIEPVATSDKTGPQDR